mmetsp:Transcript_33273/g.54973  ORF Transcript_33273/g.54973 Transcript_33273/m.54973 type:complete len:343 (-) Transcript_33273:382-1410(-)
MLAATPRSVLRATVVVTTLVAFGALAALFQSPRPALFLEGATSRVEIAPGVWMPRVNLGQGEHLNWLKLGGRGLDTAYDYGDADQRENGDSMRKSGVPRSEVFVTTKVPCCPAKFWCSTGSSDDSGPRWWDWPPVGPEGANGSVLAQSDLMRLAEHNLAMLGLDYVDLIVLHMPCATPELSLARYRVLEEFFRRGKTRAIGVSNFDGDQLAALISQANIKPAVNQFGYSIGTPRTPWMQDNGEGDRTQATVAKTQALNVTIVAYGPLGQTTGQSVKGVITNPIVTSIAEAHGKSGAQVALRYLVQRGINVVTGGHNPKHFAEDIAVLDFQLTEEEMSRLAAA